MASPLSRFLAIFLQCSVLVLVSRLDRLYNKVSYFFVYCVREALDCFSRPFFGFYRTKANLWLVENCLLGDPDTPPGSSRSTRPPRPRGVGGVVWRRCWLLSSPPNTLKIRGVSKGFLV